MRAIKLCAVVAVVALVAIACQSAETADVPAGNAAADAARNEAGEEPATEATTPAADQEERSEPAAPRAEGDRLAELLASDDYLLLDVRRPDELEEYGTVEGFLNIPIEELADRLEEVPRDRPILTA